MLSIKEIKEIVSHYKEHIKYNNNGIKYYVKNKEYGDAHYLDGYNDGMSTVLYAIEELIVKYEM